MNACGGFDTGSHDDERLVDVADIVKLVEEQTGLVVDAELQRECFGKTEGSTLNLQDFTEFLHISDAECWS